MLWVRVRIFRKHGIPKNTIQHFRHVCPSHAAVARCAIVCVFPRTALIHSTLPAEILNRISVRAVLPPRADGSRSPSFSSGSALPVSLPFIFVKRAANPTDTNVARLYRPECSRHQTRRVSGRRTCPARLSLGDPLVLSNQLPSYVRNAAEVVIQQWILQNFIS